MAKLKSKNPFRLPRAFSELRSSLAQYAPDRAAGEPILAKLTKAPGNSAAIGGLKVVAKSDWFAAQPSGTENIYKIYAESFIGESHLKQIVSEAQDIVNNALHGF